MRCFIILLLILYLTLNVYSRPTQNEGGGRASEEELEYEMEPDEKDARLKPEIKDTSEEQSQRYIDMSKNSYPRSLNKNGNGVEFSDYKHANNKDDREVAAEDMSNVFEGFQLYPKQRRQTYRYSQVSDSQDTQRNTIRNLNTLKANHNSILTDEIQNKRTILEPKRPLNEESDSLFEKEQTDKVDKNDYNNEPIDSNQHPSKQYYNVIQPESQGMADSRGREDERFYYSRDRRNVDNNQPNPDNLTIVENQEQKENEESSSEEDGEAAIKRHIQKLSSEELQDLMDSLSEEKRNLLKKIIDESNLTDDNDAIQKREITKKGEAVEDNSCNDNGQLDSSKIQSANFAVTDSIESQSTDSPESIKQLDSSKSENSDTSNTKIPDSKLETKSMYTFQGSSMEQKSEVAVSSGTDVDLDAKSEIVSEPVTDKNENKREANVSDLADMSKDDQSYSSLHDEDSQTLDDEDQFQFDDDLKTFKREVDQQAELDSRMKSLEDSFPNSDMYDESPGPLVRVKRKNTDANIKKRSAASLSDAKVAFFPYRSESDDDDEEGNEFDDEGFYERAHVCNKNIEEESSAQNYANTHPSIKDRQVGTEYNKDSKLGTDTDSVLSGVDGVDENLMLNGGLRNKRTTDDNHLSNNDENSNEQSFNSKSSDDENKLSESVNMSNGPNYQENDAFGPLPRNYDGDLGRYKRIRRVKQYHVDDSATDT